MERGRVQGHWVETVVYSMFAVSALGTVAYLCFFNPVVYTSLVNEDQWGEYCTSVGFGVSAVLLFFLAAKPGPFSRRLLWSLIGLTAVFIAGEEIGWGQRILHYPLPELFHQLNTQDELNLHNFAAIDALNRAGILRQAASLLILGWAAFSLLIFSVVPRQGQRMEEFGLPLIPVRLLLLFLLVPYLFLARPLVRSDEIGELFFAIAITAWVVDLCIRYAPSTAPRGGKAVFIMLGVFLACALVTTAFARKYPGSLKGSLDDMAYRRYPGQGMYDQADRIYRYIYAHPRLLKPDTRIHHARMLLVLGRQDEASQILRKALDELAKDPQPRDRRGDFLRRRGVVHALLGEAELAEADYAVALEFDRREAEQATAPDKKAESLWSAARTLKARGDHAGALRVARQADQVAVSGKLQRKIKEWIGFLEDPVAAQARLEL